MDLKEFIEETIRGIVDATSDLQRSYEAEGILINPPVSNVERDLYEEGSTQHTYRRVELVEFDVAVTVSTETDGVGKVGLRVLSIEAGANASHAKRNEAISRVRFSIPLALHPSSAEVKNNEARKRESEKQSRAIASRKPRSVV